MADAISLEGPEMRKLSVGTERCFEGKIFKEVNQPVNFLQKNIEGASPDSGRLES